MSSNSPLLPLFSPKSIAIVGASSDYRKVGHIVAKNMFLQGYSGNLFLVNVKGSEVLGRKTFKSIADIPEVVDVAVFATPAKITLDEIEAQSGKFRTCVILAAGFKEEDNESSKENEKRLGDIISGGKTIFLGPNCAGFANPHLFVNATFLPGPIPKGNIAFISQSGALGSVMIDYLTDRTDIGFSFFASLGNKSKITESEIIEYLATDDNTKVIAMYLEDVKSGEKFINALSSLAIKKPVIIYKSGTSARGAKAAISHTGSLAGDDAVFSAAITQCGAIRAETVNEFFTLLEIYSHNMAPKRDDFIVITNAGGGGVIAADTIEKFELKLSDWNLTSDGQVKIALNPFDVRGDADAQKFIDAFEHTKDELVGGVIVIVTPQANTQIEDTAKAISGMSTDLSHPIYSVFMGKSSQDQATHILQHNNIPSFNSVEILIRSLKKAVLRLSVIRALQESGADIRREIESTLRTADPITPSIQTVLTLAEAYEVLTRYGVPMLPYHLVNSNDELEMLHGKLQYPVVAKVSSDKLVHKTDGGGIILNICSFEDLTKHYDQFSSKGLESILVQEQITGLEFLLGAKRDKTFGPVVVFGLGGVMTNHLAQVIQIVAPMNREVFYEILKSSKLRVFTEGFRGYPAFEPDKIYELMMAMQNIMLQDKTISEIDMNPVIYGRNAIPLGVDARIVKIN